MALHDSQLQIDSAFTNPDSVISRHSAHVSKYRGGDVCKIWDKIDFGKTTAEEESQKNL